jgi:hypothetical protein
MGERRGAMGERRGREPSPVRSLAARGGPRPLSTTRDAAMIGADPVRMVVEAGPRCARREARCGDDGDRALGEIAAGRGARLSSGEE